MLSFTFQITKHLTIQSNRSLLILRMIIHKILIADGTCGITSYELLTLNLFKFHKCKLVHFYYLNHSQLQNLTLIYIWKENVGSRNTQSAEIPLYIIHNILHILYVYLTYNISDIYLIYIFICVYVYIYIYIYIYNSVK